MGRDNGDRLALGRVGDGDRLALGRVGDGVRLALGRVGDGDRLALGRVGDGDGDRLELGRIDGGAMVALDNDDGFLLSFKAAGKLKKFINKWRMRHVECGTLCSYVQSHVLGVGGGVGGLNK